jgi:hypothetical protein
LRAVRKWNLTMVGIASGHAQRGRIYLLPQLVIGTTRLATMHTRLAPIETN